VPESEDGTKWQRNDPAPEELLHDERLIDFEAEIVREFDSEVSNPLHRQTWKVEF